VAVSFNFVTERIAVGGGISSKADVDQIVAAGITHVIDMRAEFDDDTLNDSRITILWLPQEDNGEMRPPGHYRRGIQFAFPALALPKTKVFPHCAAGLNRGPTMCYALLRAFGFPQREAIAMILAVRPDVLFHLIPNYLNSVERDLAS
jgi:protein-tyrosine phosphatase